MTAVTDTTQLKAQLKTQHLGTGKLLPKHQARQAKPAARRRLVVPWR